MAKSKKEFSREAMYKKIMPSILEDSVIDDNQGKVIDDHHDKVGKTNKKSGKNKDLMIHNIGDKVIDSLQKIDEHEYEDSIKVNENNDDNASEDLNSSVINKSIKSYISKRDDQLAKIVNIYELMIEEKIDSILLRFRIPDSSINKTYIVNEILKKCPSVIFTGTDDQIINKLNEEKNKNNIDIVLEAIKIIIDINKKANKRGI